jgi:hypothetical protein
MAVVRFANAVSDFHRMVANIKELYSATVSLDSFDLDDATQALIKADQVTAHGSVGAEAVSRSFRADRSRDSLYNQLKMYSEVFRMLGWLHPVGPKLRFRRTLLGEHLMDLAFHDPELTGLLQECLLGICFPNPNTENLGVRRTRYFARLLQLMDELDGVLHRDEMIVVLHTLTDGSDPEEVSRRAEVVRSMRGDGAKREALLVAVAEKNRVQTNTLKNYTRFPLGVISSRLIAWAEGVRATDLYERPVKVYRLTVEGRAQLERFSNGLDLRAADIADLPDDDRAVLVNVGFYGMLDRAGFDVADEIEALKAALPRYPQAADVLTSYTPAEVYFSPFQQATHEDISRAYDISRTVGV